ncbi:MAG: Replicative helicase / intein-containing, partial [Cyanobacteriota bacterium]
MVNRASLPPQNIEAEEYILGGILLDPEAIGRIVDGLVIDAFYVKAHRLIYEAMLSLYGQSQPTDLMSVSSWLQDHHHLEAIGGIVKLTQLADRTLSAVNIDRFAALVMDKYLRRQLIAAGHEIVDLGYDTTKELETIFDESEQKIFRLTQSRPQGGLVPLSETLINTFSELEKLHQKLTSPGVDTQFYDLDAMTGGLQRADLIILAGRPSMGKCCEANSEIVLADGRICTIAQIYEKQHAEILTLKHDWQLDWSKPSAFIDDGLKPVFRVTTKLGRSLATTLTHPYLTIRGWRSLSTLKAGDQIAVPRQLPCFGKAVLSDARIKLLAYLIGGGDLTGSYPRFTKLNPKVQQDFEQSALEFTDSNRVRKWLEELGIYGKNADTMAIPDLIFQLKRPLVALFINRLLATDAGATIVKSQHVQLGYASVSERVARQVQHLLLRFGIIARLKQCSVKDQDKRRDTWQLEITDAYSIKTFIEAIGIFGKEEKLVAIQSVLATNNCQTNDDLKLTNSDIYWDEIVSIESVGLKQVYDLTIPETHNFIANDICVHNTAFGLGVAANIAKTQNLPVAIFSLEMSKDQLALRLLASESRIDSNRLRTGHFSQTEYEPLTVALGTLSSLPIYIDDTANISVTQMRSQVRRLQSEQKEPIGLVLIDYLQLMEGSSDNRVQELSKITRSLKGLAREINAPVIALSQLSRAVESRTNKRPMMSDLRESGCLSGDSLVTLADSGKQVPIRELVGQSGFCVWALNEATMKLEKVAVSRAFSTGKKSTYLLKTRLGRTIKATANHKFLTIEGWKRLDDLNCKDYIALPRYLESPSLPLMADEELALVGHLTGAGCPLPCHSTQYTTKALEVAENVYWDSIISIQEDG